MGRLEKHQLRKMPRRKYAPIAERVRSLTSDFKDNKTYSTKISGKINECGSFIRAEEDDELEIEHYPQREVYCAQIGSMNGRAYESSNSYMRQMFADQMAARRIFSDALETQDHVFDSATSATRLVHLSQ